VKFFRKKTIFFAARKKLKALHCKVVFIMITTLWLRALQRNCCTKLKYFP